MTPHTFGLASFVKLAPLSRVILINFACLLVIVWVCDCLLKIILSTKGFVCLIDVMLLWIYFLKV